MYVHMHTQAHCAPVRRPMCRSAIGDYRSTANHWEILQRRSQHRTPTCLRELSLGLWGTWPIRLCYPCVGVGNHPLLGSSSVGSKSAPIHNYALYPIQFTTTSRPQSATVTVGHSPQACPRHTHTRTRPGRALWGLYSHIEASSPFKRRRRRRLFSPSLPFLIYPTRVLLREREARATQTQSQLFAEHTAVPRSPHLGPTRRDREGGFGSASGTPPRRRASLEFCSLKRCPTTRRCPNPPRPNHWPWSR